MINNTVKFNTGDVIIIITLFNRNKAMITATTIDEVIVNLDKVINWSKQKQSRIGYFAAMYRKMTIAVKHGINNQLFDDGKRMELLDVIFANRYFHAWEAYINKQKCTNAWCVAFDACYNNNLIVLQHLFLGINTHINLDLGIAAAETCTPDSLAALEPDFIKINKIIAEQSQIIQNDLSEVFPPLKYITAIAKHYHEAVLNFSIETARKASWANAVALSNAVGDARSNYINIMDNTVVILANRIINPGVLFRFALKPVLQMESKKVSEIIELLYD